MIGAFRRDTGGAMHWMVILISLAVLAVPLAASSRWFVWPVSVVATAETITVVRRTPLGAHDGVAQIDVVTPDGMQCSHRRDVLFQRAAGDLVVYPTPRHLRHCINAPGPAAMTVSWRVKLFGWLPLRAVVTQHLTE